jgi:hypothetical protein
MPSSIRVGEILGSQLVKLSAVLVFCLAHRQKPARRPCKEDRSNYLNVLLTFLGGL